MEDKEPKLIILDSSGNEISTNNVKLKDSSKIKLNGTSLNMNCSMKDFIKKLNQAGIQVDFRKLKKESRHGSYKKKKKDRLETK